MFQIRKIDNSGSHVSTNHFLSNWHNSFQNAHATASLGLPGAAILATLLPPAFVASLAGAASPTLGAQVSPFLFKAIHSDVVRDFKAFQEHGPYGIFY